ncbi:uncharacterized protein [Lolium perenne]|uniref:uncharacterized protein n=1 Tax=Lolium perenne TaxID=4522 RepID=UPI0021F56F3D|nr:uncharacterized protein LOC127339306 [Lolium perenne]
MLYADYFTDEPLHLEAVFRRRFGMRRDLFLKIMYAIRNLDLYFRCKPDCTDMIGFSSLQKCTVAMRLLACGAPGGNADDYLCMAESTVIDCLYKFCRTIIAVFGELYLISPTTQDTERILAIKAASGFPVILGNSNNNINILQCSPVFAKLVEGHAPSVNYEVSVRHYNKGYYLADGIYPTWSTFVKMILSPKLPKEVRFAKEQEAARKDVKRVSRSFSALVCQSPARVAAVLHRTIDIVSVYNTMACTSSSSTA